MSITLRSMHVPTEQEIHAEVKGERRRIMALIIDHKAMYNTHARIAPDDLVTLDRFQDTINRLVDDLIVITY